MDTLLEAHTFFGRSDSKLESGPVTRSSRRSKGHQSPEPGNIPYVPFSGPSNDSKRKRPSSDIPATVLESPSEGFPIYGEVETKIGIPQYNVAASYIPRAEPMPSVSTRRFRSRSGSMGRLPLPPGDGFDFADLGGLGGALTSASTSRQVSPRAPGGGMSDDDLEDDLEDGMEDGGDGMSSRKRSERLRKNRKAAQQSRERKKRYIIGLEQQVRALTSQNIELRCDNTKLRAQLGVYMQMDGGQPEWRDAGESEPRPKSRKVSSGRAASDSKRPKVSLSSSSIAQSLPSLQIPPTYPTDAIPTTVLPLASTSEIMQSVSDMTTSLPVLPTPLLHPQIPPPPSVGPAPDNMLSCDPVQQVKREAGLRDRPTRDGPPTAQHILERRVSKRKRKRSNSVNNPDVNGVELLRTLRNTRVLSQSPSANRVLTHSGNRTV
eukprot:937951_1